MWKKLRDYFVPCLIFFFVSLLVFAAAMPRFGTYLAVLCALEWICIFLYGRKENFQFFFSVLSLGMGNILAFILQWLLLKRIVSYSNVDPLEFILLVLLFAGTIIILAIVFKNEKKSQSAKPQKTSHLFFEREHDLHRLESFLQSGVQIIGVDARWGDGKTFLIEQMCILPQIQDYYEIIRINVLAGNEDEIELILMNEFDQILRRNHIFSMASKQMLKLLEGNDILKQLQWLFIKDTQSISTTFSSVLNDLEKLDKKVLIVVDDIERLGNENLIRKVFALMESVTSDKVQIIYLFNSMALVGFDRAYLEKYIPCYMSLTPIRFRSIVRSLWDELRLDMTELACKDIEGMVEFPKSNYSIENILALSPPEDRRPFQLDNITIRRVRVFLEEFRDLSNQRSTSNGKENPTFSNVERELLLKCIFIKHFLHVDFEKIKIGTSVIDSFLFHLDEDAKTVLKECNFPTPVFDDVPLFYLFDIRQHVGLENMQRFTKEIFTDNGNYNRLLALSLLGFDYMDIWERIRQAEQPNAKINTTTTGIRNKQPLDRFMIRAEQIGNEDISNIERERNNERIDRVIWNLLANGTSERTDFDAYIKHFQELVLNAAPKARNLAWQEFASDAFHQKIYKDNSTRNRFAVDQYLPLFQGFRVTNAHPDQWMELLGFYFNAIEENAISVEMIQNLNYVDMTNHRVYISVLQHFAHCPVVGNLNAEPCMYQFLRQTLRQAFSLGYTKNQLFHALWYPSSDVLETGERIPSDLWENAVMKLTGQFDSMQRSLENDKLSKQNLTAFDSDIDVIIGFIEKCRTLITTKKTIRMRTLHVEVKESVSRSRHQELCDTFQQRLQSGMDVNEWNKQIDSAYEDGKLDPYEVRKLINWCKQSFG